MMMGSNGFDAVAKPALPSRAWLFHSAGSRATLIHGTEVRTTEHGFFEGCASIPNGQSITQAREVFGTGMHIADGRYVFVSASHTLESLYIHRHADSWTVSNSLAFLTAFHEAIPPYDSAYGGTFASSCLGIDAYRQDLFRAAGGQITRVMYDNLEVDEAGNHKLIRKLPPPRFADFRSYVDYLTTTLEGASTTFKDGRADNLLATCSTGYDSACAAAIVRPLGCREAVTLRESRDGRCDSGRQVGEALGLRVHEFDRAGAIEGDAEDAAEFLATGMGGEDYCFRNFAPMLMDRVLLTGFHGGKIWDASVPANSILERGDVSGSSLQEYRLWKGFVHIPVPMIGARRHADIRAISRSPEMAAFRLNNRYDRPIPRRILEEAGVPRDLFGQQKEAASSLIFLDRRLIGRATASQIQDALPQGWRRRSHVLHSAAWKVRNRIHHQRADFPGGMWLGRRLVSDWRLFEHSRPEASEDFVGALLTVTGRYGCILSNPDGFQTRPGLTAKKIGSVDSP